MCGRFHYAYRASSNCVISCIHNQEEDQNITLTSSPVVKVTALVTGMFSVFRNDLTLTAMGTF